MFIKNDLDTIKSYFEDSSNLKGGYAEEVIYPENIAELSEVMKDANIKKTPVTVSGGGTGTTGARIPFGGIVISTERLNGIRDMSKKNMTSIIGPGVLVEDFKNACESEGLFYTCHPTEKTAFVGGTVATNASGSRSFKYGPTRRSIRRLKMVLPNGEMLEVRRGERIISKESPQLTLNSGLKIRIPLPAYKMPKTKNSAGYFAKDGMDLIDLFIGQEGTLSIIAEIEMALESLPNKILSTFVFFKKELDAWHFSRDLKSLSKDIGLKGEVRLNILSVEYFDNNALGLLRIKNPNVPKNANASIFFEQEISGGKDYKPLEENLEIISRYNVSLDDTWVAMNQKEIDDFTAFRHFIPEAINEAVRRNGFQKLSTDIAVPDKHFLDMMSFYADTLKKEDIERVLFGHIGEDHIHMNLLPKSEKQFHRAKELCLTFVTKAVSLGGTVSAEHGIGKIKHKFLEVMYGKDGILEMTRIKKSLDSNCILGLDNIFPKELVRLA